MNLSDAQITLVLRALHTLALESDTSHDAIDELERTLRIEQCDRVIARESVIGGSPWRVEEALDAREALV